MLQRMTRGWVTMKMMCFLLTVQGRFAEADYRVTLFQIAIRKLKVQRQTFQVLVDQEAQ